MRTKQSRRWAALAAVVALAVASALVARGRYKPFSPEAPGFRTLGPADAKVVIIEFSDLQCPACRYAEGPLRQLLEMHKGKVRFVFKHFPLQGHPWARPAAIAAECAGRQGRFWDYHHMLYDKQPEWYEAEKDEFLVRFARELKLDAAAWEACRKEPSAAAAVSADYQDGEHALVGSTPTFFINGRRFIGGKQLAELGSLHLERELRE